VSEGEAAWRERHQTLARRGTVAIVGKNAPTTVDDSHAAAPGGHDPAEITDMNRRKLLRLLSIATTTLATPVVIDWDRVRFATVSGRIDAAVLDQYANLNRLLWKSYSEAHTKATCFAGVCEHLATLLEGLRGSRNTEHRCRQLELIADVLQLTGEVLLD